MGKNFLYYNIREHLAKFFLFFRFFNLNFSGKLILIGKMDKNCHFLIFIKAKIIIKIFLSN